MEMGGEGCRQLKRRRQEALRRGEWSCEERWVLTFHRRAERTSLVDTKCGRPKPSPWRSSSITYTTTTTGTQEAITRRTRTAPCGRKGDTDQGQRQWIFIHM